MIVKMKAKNKTLTSIARKGMEQQRAARIEMLKNPLTKKEIMSTHDENFKNLTSRNLVTEEE